MLTLILLASISGEPQFKVENKTTPKCTVCGPTCPCAASDCKDGKCPVPAKGVAQPVGSGVRVTVTSGGRFVRVNPATAPRIAIVFGGGYHLGDGQGWWPGKAMGRLPRR